MNTNYIVNLAMTEQEADLYIIFKEQCEQVNKSNPLVVAENIVEMSKLLKRIKALIDSGDWKLPEGFCETEINWLNSVVNKISEVK